MNAENLAAIEALVVEGERQERQWQIIAIEAREALTSLRASLGLTPIRDERQLWIKLRGEVA